MPTLLVKNADLIVTMDGQDRELKNAAIFCRDGFIEQIGSQADLPQTADEVLDLRHHVVLPGLVNTHHHFYQTLTRALPAAQDANLFNWLTTLYPIWARMNPEDIFTSTQTALAELALSGCTTASDHLYLFPNGSKLDAVTENRSSRSQTPSNPAPSRCTARAARSKAWSLGSTSARSNSRPSALLMIFWATATTSPSRRANSARASASSSRRPTSSPGWTSGMPGKAMRLSCEVDSGSSSMIRPPLREAP